MKKFLQHPLVFLPLLVLSIPLFMVAGMIVGVVLPWLLVGLVLYGAVGILWHRLRHGEWPKSEPFREKVPDERFALAVRAAHGDEDAQYMLDRIREFEETGIWRP